LHFLTTSVLGANGRTGIELVKQGLERNYRVTAFVRDDKSFLEDSSLRKNQNLLIVRGSPTSQNDVDRVVEGQDVVVNVIGVGEQHSISPAFLTSKPNLGSHLTKTIVIHLQARLMSNDTTIGSHSQVILNNALKKHGKDTLNVVCMFHSKVLHSRSPKLTSSRCSFLLLLQAYEDLL
jgi:hypothetical protein